MATLNLQNDNVIEMDLTLEEARELTDDTVERIAGQIDEAQGIVHMERATEAFLVIRIKRKD